MDAVTLGLVGKLLAAVALVAIAGTVGTITYINHTRPQALGLASATPRTPAPSPSPEDPLAAACRPPPLRSPRRPCWGCGFCSLAPSPVTGRTRSSPRSHLLTTPLPAPTTCADGSCLVAPTAHPRAQ